MARTTPSIARRRPFRQHDVERPVYIDQLARTHVAATIRRYPRLLADIGGSDHRFGWVAGAGERALGIVAAGRREPSAVEIRCYLFEQAFGASVSLLSDPRVASGACESPCSFQGLGGYERRLIRGEAPAHVA